MIHERKRATDFSDRHEYLGASEAGQALGLSEYGSPEDLYDQKTLRAPRTEHKAIFDRGHDMEPIIMWKLQADKCLITAVEAEASQENRPWLVSHLDGVINFKDYAGSATVPDWATGDGVLEMKAPGSRMASKFKNDGQPDNHIIQLQLNTENTGLKWGVIVFMDYDAYELVLTFYKLDDGLIEKALIVLDGFWAQVLADKWEGGYLTGPEPEVEKELVKHKVVDGELANGDQLGQLYTTVLTDYCRAEQELKLFKGVVQTKMDEDGVTTTFLGTDVKITKVFRKGSFTYKGKDLYQWTGELCEAITNEDMAKAEKMVRVFLTEEDLFKKQSKNSVSYKYTPSKVEV